MTFHEIIPHIRAGKLAYRQIWPANTYLLWRKDEHNGFLAIGGRGSSSLYNPNHIRYHNAPQDIDAHDWEIKDE